ncbi:MAG TPA: hypothetical protein VHE30_03840 [Polyangiaceae bacterium]|nr:hypothetical protein [Polyangiaceae bacterium]
MTTENREGAALFSRAVRETLDTLVAPKIRDALIHDALALGGLASLPTTRAAMRAFATGPLRKVTERALGAELAHSVADEILRVVPPALPQRSLPKGKASRSSPPPPLRRSATPSPGARRTQFGPGTNPRSQSPDPGSFRPVPAPLSSRPDRAFITTPPRGMMDARSYTPGPVSMERRTRGAMDEATLPPPNSGAVPSRPRAGTSTGPVAPNVVVATTDPALLDALTEWFADRAVVSRALDAAELVRLLDQAEDRRSIVIVDGKSPSVRPGALAVLLEAMPRVEVVLCRAAPATEQVVLSASPATARWIVYREPASLDHVAAECVRLVS